MSVKSPELTPALNRTMWAAKSGAIGPGSATSGRVSTAMVDPPD
jgi:hypothetical protein